MDITTRKQYSFVSKWIFEFASELKVNYKINDKNIRDNIAASIKTIKYLSKRFFAELKDNDTTWKHSIRVSLTSTLIAELLRNNEHFPQREKITDQFIQEFAIASLFHDIGKLEIENSLLTKKGKLTPHEYSRIQEHTNLGSQLIFKTLLTDTIKNHFQLNVGNIQKMAAEIAIKHHEKMDGSGYPNQLTHKDIPFYVNIVTVADVIDARSDSSRPYNTSPLFPSQSIPELNTEHFDPHILETCLFLFGMELESNNDNSKTTLPFILLIDTLFS